MCYVGIWYNDSGEIVKEEYVTAKDSTEASSIIHQRYSDRVYPGPNLTVMTKNGKPDPEDVCVTSNTATLF